MGQGFPRGERELIKLLLKDLVVVYACERGEISAIKDLGSVSTLDIKNAVSMHNPCHKAIWKKRWTYLPLRYYLFDVELI